MEELDGKQLSRLEDNFKLNCDEKDEDREKDNFEQNKEIKIYAYFLDFIISNP